MAAVSAEASRAPASGAATASSALAGGGGAAEKRDSSWRLLKDFGRLSARFGRLTKVGDRNGDGVAVAGATVAAAGVEVAAVAGAATAAVAGAAAAVAAGAPLNDGRAEPCAVASSSSSLPPSSTQSAAAVGAANGGTVTSDAIWRYCAVTGVGTLRLCCIVSGENSASKSHCLATSMGVGLGSAAASS